MQVSLTATGGLERRLEVAVPAERVAKEVQQFGEQVHAEVVSDLMRSSFAEAVTQQELKPATGPRIEPIAFEPGADLKYAAVFEVLPDIKLKGFDTLAVERPQAEVTEADVDAMIESMRRQKPNFTEVARPAQATDRVLVDYDGSIDGKPLEGGAGRDVHFIVGSGRVLPELDAAVVGASAGDTRTVQVNYPQNHASKELAGRAAEFVVAVKKVEEMGLPQVDEEFCRAYGVEEGGVEALRAEVRKSMERELAVLVRNRVSAQVMDALYRDYPLDVPRTLVDDAVQRLQIETAQRMGIRDVNQLPPRQNFEPPAQRRVALGMIIGEIVRAEQLSVDRGKVQERLEDLVASYPNADEARRAYLSNADAMRQIESAVMEDQVVDLVMARARVIDRPATFKELTGFGEESERT